VTVDGGQDVSRTTLVGSWVLHGSDWHGKPPTCTSLTEGAVFSSSTVEGLPTDVIVEG